MQKSIQNHTKHKTQFIMFLAFPKNLKFRAKCRRVFKFQNHTKHNIHYHSVGVLFL